MAYLFRLRLEGCIRTERNLWKGEDSLRYFQPLNKRIQIQRADSLQYLFNGDSLQSYTLLAVFWPFEKLLSKKLSSKDFKAAWPTQNHRVQESSYHTAIS